MCRRLLLLLLVRARERKGVPQGGQVGLLSLPFHLRESFFAAPWLRLYQHSFILGNKWVVVVGGGEANLVELSRLLQSAQ